MCFFWSTLNPRPSPTRMITDAIPHTIPNIVRKVRILWARNVAERLAQDFGESHGEALKFQGFKVNKVSRNQHERKDLETLKP